MAAFLIDDDAKPNPRARAILLHLVGVHMVMVGTVAFVDINPEQVVTVLRDFP